MQHPSTVPAFHTVGIASLQEGSRLRPTACGSIQFAISLTCQETLSFPIHLVSLFISHLRAGILPHLLLLGTQISILPFAVIQDSVLNDGEHSLGHHGVDREAAHVPWEPQQACSGGSTWVTQTRDNNVFVRSFPLKVLEVFKLISAFRKRGWKCI